MHFLQHFHPLPPPTGTLPRPPPTGALHPSELEAQAPEAPRESSSTSPMRPRWGRLFTDDVRGLPHLGLIVEGLRTPLGAPLLGGGQGVPMGGMLAGQGVCLLGWEGGVLPVQNAVCPTPWKNPKSTCCAIFCLALTLTKMCDISMHAWGEGFEGQKQVVWEACQAADQGQNKATVYTSTLNPRMALSNLQEQQHTFQEPVCFHPPVFCRRLLPGGTPANPGICCCCCG